MAKRAMNAFEFNPATQQIVRNGKVIDEATMNADVNVFEDYEQIFIAVRHLGLGLKKYYRKRPFKVAPLAQEIADNGPTVTISRDELYKRIVRMVCHW